MEEWLLSIVERTALALILGGGITLAFCVRPVLISDLGPGVEKSKVAFIDALRIAAWERYDSFALICILIVIGLQGVSLLLSGELGFLRLGACVVVVGILLRKLFLHRAFKARLALQPGLGSGAYGSVVIPAEEVALRLWTIAALVLTLLLLNSL